jgi:hypothetical protein
MNELKLYMEYKTNMCQIGRTISGYSGIFYLLVVSFNKNWNEQTAKLIQEKEIEVYE